MTTTWKDLMAIFHLEDEVAAFIRARARALAEDRHDFHLVGSSSSTLICDIKTAHPPHEMGGYNTVRYGFLQDYCIGRSGPTPEGELNIVVERRSAGDAASPARFKGYWFLAPKEGGDGHG